MSPPGYSMEPRSLETRTQHPAVRGQSTRGLAMADGLLLLHAFPLDHTMWDEQVRHFEHNFPVVAPDFPGFGEGALSSFEPTMDGAADAAAAAMDQAGIDRAVVCGLS